MKIFEAYVGIRCNLVYPLNQHVSLPYFSSPVQNKKAGYQTNNRLFELNIDVRYNMSRTISPALTHPSIGMETGKHEVHAEVGEDDCKETDAGDDCHLCPFPTTDVT